MKSAIRPSDPGRYMLIVFTLSLVAFVGGLLTATRLLQRVTLVDVPDLEQKSVEEARSMLRVKRLGIEISEYRFDQRVPLNHILAQDPEPEQEVKSGRNVRVVVSRGPQAVTAPDVAHLTLRQATLVLGEKGLNPGRIARMFDGGVPKDAVIAQSPLPGRPTSRGAGVDLLLSLGPRPLRYVMPDLKGWRLDEATRMLNHIGLELLEIKREVDDTQPTGMVTEQTPKPGVRIESGDPAGLVATIQTVDQQQTSRLVTITYLVPPAGMEVRVKMVLRDDTGLHDIHNTMERPNSEVTIRHAVQGAEANLYIYVNGVLKEERLI